MGTLRLLQSFSLLFRRSSSKPLLSIISSSSLQFCSRSPSLASSPHQRTIQRMTSTSLMENEDVHAYLNLLDKIPGARRLMNKIKPFLKSTKAIWSKVGSSMGAKIKEATKEMMAKFPDIAAKVGA